RVGDRNRAGSEVHAGRNSQPFAGPEQHLSAKKKRRLRTLLKQAARTAERSLLDEGSNGSVRANPGTDLELCGPCCGGKHASTDGQPNSGCAAACPEHRRRVPS